jgi:hypothetical protein
MVDDDGSMTNTYLVSRRHIQKLPISQISTTEILSTWLEPEFTP